MGGRGPSSRGRTPAAGEGRRRRRGRRPESSPAFPWRHLPPGLVLLESRGAGRPDGDAGLHVSPRRKCVTQWESRVHLSRTHFMMVLHQKGFRRFSSRTTQFLTDPGHFTLSSFSRADSGGSWGAWGAGHLPCPHGLRDARAALSSSSCDSGRGDGARERAWPPGAARRPSRASGKEDADGHASAPLLGLPAAE